MSWSRNGLGRKIDGSGLHRPDGHRDVAVTGHQHHGQLYAERAELVLKVEAAHAGQPNVDDEAADTVSAPGLQELPSRAIALRG
jgi:hypothetical protein